MTTTRAKHINIPMILIAGALAMFMGSLDGTIVNIALPTIAEAFDLTTTAASWVCTIYLLVAAGSLLIVGKIADTVGYKKLFILGFIIFTLGSFCCGALPELFDSYPVLLICRVFQALGAVIMLVISPALVTSYLPPERQGKGMSLVMLFASLGIALGPTLGGLITEYLSWHWVFFINVPIGIAAVIIGCIFLPKDHVSTATMKGFDGVGAALIFIGIAALLFLISEGTVLGWGSLPIIVSLIIAVLGLGGFILRERKAKMPILDLKLFRDRSFSLGNIIYALSFLIFSGAFFLLPFYLQDVMMFDSAHAGYIISTLSFGLMIAGIVTGAIYAKIAGKRKYLLAISLLFIAAGFFLLSHLNPFSSIGLVIAGLSCIGLGLGAVTTALSTMLLGSAPKEKQGMVSSLVTLERMAPMTIGIAVFNLLMIAGCKYIANHMTTAETPIAGMMPEILSKGFDFCFIVGMILALVIFVLTFFIREKESA
ncbi:MAG TPA: DHA2 family efflux MFS transporter permease subunit [Methanocorpusculum sp.]|nr:DHA2 family efflux MFS transporter permease subunit [Methanocorpusculum sp.]